ncbi:MAG TPA: hypothetical protein VK982_07920, partial [Bacteroidales bacterium]|nr:hypothetical protein [Bacteroidales bacterium]
DGVWAEKINTTLDSSFEVGDKIYRVYPSGKKVFGIAAAFDKVTRRCTTDPNNSPVTHFISLETYNDEGGVQKSLGYGLGLEKYKYEKAPIFITDDGVELFNLDDTIYSVNKSQNYLTLSPRPVKKELGNVNIPKYMYNFSTKKAAEEWQENNKPKYSISDVEKAICNLWDGRLKTDDSAFGKALKEGFTRAFFKELNKNNGKIIFQRI